MRVLFLTYDLPYPLTTGGKLRAHHLIKGLAKDHEITLFSFIRELSQLRYLSEVKKHCLEVRTFKRRYVWDLRNILLATFSPYPLAAATYTSPRLKRDLKEELEEKKYDLVHFESFYPALYLPMVKALGFKTLMGNENVEFRIYQRYVKRQSLFLRLPLYFDVLKMRGFETGLWRKATANIAVSEKDAKEVTGVTGKDCPVVPNAVAVEEFEHLPHGGREKPAVLIIGNLNYISHADAVRYFLEQIYPRIKATFADFALTLVSGVRPLWLENFLTDPAIKFIQDKESPARDLLGLGDVVAVPVRVAGGTRLRILEAMAAGLPVVSTTIGLEGIEATPGEHILVADKPSKFAHGIARLLENRALRRRIGEQSRILVKSKYTWEKSVEALEKVYRRIGNVKRLG